MDVSAAMPQRRSHNGQVLLALAGDGQSRENSHRRRAAIHFVTLLSNIAISIEQCKCPVDQEKAAFARLPFSWTLPTVGIGDHCEPNTKAPIGRIRLRADYWPTRENPYRRGRAPIGYFVILGARPLVMAPTSAIFSNSQFSSFRNNVSFHFHQRNSQVFWRQ